ncbi:MAG: hypothetical protein ACTHKF_03960 [Candidatus Nitrosocosmicus sp.]
MLWKNTHKLTITLTILSSLIPISALSVILPINNVFADNICIGVFPCSANGGDGGRGGDTGEAIGGDIGPGGSCFANDHSTIGDECGGSTGSSEPRSGSGDKSMNGGNGGEASVNLSG